MQRQREWPTRFIQAIQSFAQKRLLGSVLRSQGVARIPWVLRLFFRTPIVRNIPARILAFGVGRAHVRADQRGG